LPWAATRSPSAGANTLSAIITEYFAQIGDNMRSTEDALWRGPRPKDTINVATTLVEYLTKSPMVLDETVSSQLVEQRLGFSEDRHVEAFGEPAVDRR
jgi:hypothetical protein